MLNVWLWTCLESPGSAGAEAEVPVLAVLLPLRGLEALVDLCRVLLAVLHENGVSTHIPKLRQKEEPTTKHEEKHCSVFLVSITSS